MKKALGRGLDALIPDKGDEIVLIDIERILPDPDQPRKTFKEDSLKELAASIKEKGIIQPIIVTRVGNGTFRIIAGERRWRASNIAGIKKVPCIIKESEPDNSLEISLIENIQRENLNPIETARAFQRLVSEFNITQEGVSIKVGKDRATVSNYLRLLNLPDEIKSLVSEGRLSMGHAKAILSLLSIEDQIKIAKKVIKGELSVRETEKLSKKIADVPRGTSKPERDPNVISIEDELISTLGTKVRIMYKEGRGKIEIEYYSIDELNRLIDIFRK